MKQKPRASLLPQLPVRLRLTVMVSSLVVVMLLILGLSLYFSVYETLQTRLENSAQSTANDLFSSEHTDGAPLIVPGPLVPNPDNTTAITNTAQIATEVKVDITRFPSLSLVYHPDGALLAEDPNGLRSTTLLAEVARNAARLPDGESYTTIAVLTNPDTNNQERFFIYARPFYGLANPQDSAGGEKIVGIYLQARSYEETATLLDTMQRVLLISLPISLIISLLVGIFMTGRLLRPIRALTETARQISVTDLNRRVGLHTKDEMGRLAQTFDDMIERLQTSFKHQKRFLADASHELRTPLAVIEAEATLMLKRPRDAEDYRRSLELIATEATRLNKLLEDMLTLARADNGEQELRTRPIALDDLATEAVEQINLLAHQKSQQLKLDFNEEILINGDPEILTNLFVNLLSNAVKYTPERGTISVRVYRTPTNEASFAVADNGPGIPPEHLPHIFDRFYRIDRARTRTGSSGLGLAIARWAAEAHGGRISVESAPGQGSLFTVTLPRI